MTEPVPRGGCRECAFTDPAGWEKSRTGAESLVFCPGDGRRRGGGQRCVRKQFYRYQVSGGMKAG